MQAYTEPIHGTRVTFKMLPIPGGEFLMGSPESEVGRLLDEGPQIRVKIDPFWMGQHEVTWDEFLIWSEDRDIKRRVRQRQKPTPLDFDADAVTRPTAPYTEMSMGMGTEGGYPAILMTQHAAKTYCLWLSKKTGHYYRLPTEAEWEYACRAGTTTRYSFGDDDAELDDHAWHWKNCNGQYQKVGTKKPNPWGLYDMHGNVEEWCLDKYDPEFYDSIAFDQPVDNPLLIPDREYPRVARGGSWYYEDSCELRSAARSPSSDDWKVEDAETPRSIWYLTSNYGIGFRLVRPLVVPDEATRVARQYDPILPKDARENSHKRNRIEQVKEWYYKQQLQETSPEKSTD